MQGTECLLQETIAFWRLEISPWGQSLKGESGILCSLIILWFFFFFYRENLVPRISTAASSPAKQEGVGMELGRGAFGVRVYFGQNKNNLKGGKGAKQSSRGALGSKKSTRCSAFVSRWGGGRVRPLLRLLFPVTEPQGSQGGLCAEIS